MIDRLRLLLDRPLDPLAARAVVVLASAILLGYAAVFVLGASEPDRTISSRDEGQAQTARPPAPATALVDGISQDQDKRRPTVPRQDSQDKKGSAAARRVTRALRSHRALQHVPYRSRGLSVLLVGARGGRALIRVSAPTVRAAHRGWRRFLWRYRDSGRAYVPLFRVKGDRGG